MNVERFAGIRTPFYYYDTNILRQTLDAINAETKKHNNYFVHYAVKANANEKVLVAMKVDGVEANEENILNGSYIIQRPVMFVTGDAISPSEQAFIDYIFSQVGYDTVESNGYIPAFTPAA